MEPSALQVGLASGEEVGKDDPLEGQAPATLGVLPADSPGEADALTTGSALCLVDCSVESLDSWSPPRALWVVPDATLASLVVRRMRDH